MARVEWHALGREAQLHRHRHLKTGTGVTSAGDVQQLYMAGQEQSRLWASDERERVS